MPAERRSFSDAIEPILYWDASFAVALSIETDPYHRESQLFRSRLESEGTLSVSSEFVHNELMFRIIKGRLEDEGRAIGRGWVTMKQNRPDLIVDVMPEVNDRIAELDRLTMKLPIDEGITERVALLITDYQILPTDAYHIAIALDSGVNSFVSLDADFLRVDGIIVYTCSP